MSRAGIVFLYVVALAGGTYLAFRPTFDSDFARMSRQQATLKGVRDRVLRLNLLPQLPALLNKGSSAVQTNLSPTEILSLAKLGSQIEPDALSSLVVDRELVSSYTGIGGAALLMPNRPAIQRAIQQAFADPRVVAEAARVEISATPGLAWSRSS